MAIVFGTSFTQLNYRWTEWNTILVAKHFEPQFHVSSELYTVYGYDEPDVHFCQIFVGDVPSSALSDYSQEQNDADKVEFEAISGSWGKQIVKKQSTNQALLVAQAGREGNETIYASHNFCDPTSWFGDSVRFSEVLSGSGTVFSGTYSNWICMNRGSVLDENGWCEDVSHGYSVIVVANNVTMSARNPLEDIGGEYTVNYESGSITFLTGTYSVGQVTASYSYENGSTFTISPTLYKKLDIEEVEAQFTSDVIMNDTIIFGVYGNVEVFAPQHWQGNGGPFPTGHKLQLQTQQYRSLAQLIDEALGSYPVVPAIGGTKRGLTSPMYGFPFRYGTVRSLYSAYGLEVRIWLEQHKKCDGQRVSATFYCIASDE